VYSVLCTTYASDADDDDDDDDNDGDDADDDNDDDDDGDDADMLCRSLGHNRVTLIEPGAWQFCPHLIDLYVFNHFLSLAFHSEFLSYQKK